ncbi:MAG: M42 family metallopeptidase [Firmicutes bacterium]|nr:M42 family metallopeptidase [Candidatus Fermentithermobacillaceae bacterium]
MDVKAFLKKVSEAPGVSGFEYRTVAPIIQEFMAPLVDEIRTDALGNLIGFKRGEAGRRNPKVMLAGHMDEVGLIVTKIDDRGFLRFTDMGGVDPRILPGHEVVVHGKMPLRGIVGVKPPHVMTADEMSKTYKMEDLFIDVGLPAEKVRELVSVGDLVTYHRQFTELMGDLVAGKSFDDRAGVAVILVALEELRKYRYTADVYAVATTQEEAGLRGATVSSYGIFPDVAIAIDVCQGDTPGVPEWRTQSVGKGPALCVGGNIHPKVYEGLTKAAADLGISVQQEVAPGPTGTDAWAMQMAREGVATGLISIPLRYMHTSVETLSVGDIEKAGKILARFIASVDAGFVEGLTKWI